MRSRYTLLVYLSGRLEEAPPRGGKVDGRSGAAGEASPGARKRSRKGASDAPPPPQQQQFGGGGGAAQQGAEQAGGGGGGGEGEQDQEEEADASRRAVQDLRGGATAFWVGRKMVAAVEPRPGTALLHLHGDDCLEHEALLVERGVKYVLRSDLVCQRGAATAGRRLGGG